MASEFLGAVVVGMGIAGKVRVRDILQQEKLPKDQQDLKGVKLIGYVSRRELEIEGAEPLSLDEALQREDVNLILVCAENERHEDITRKSIEAKKHVLVEFPLAMTSDKAKELLELADENGVVCYEEDISLLLQEHTTLQRLAKERGLKEGALTIAGRPNGWIEDIEKSGPPFATSMDMIHRVLDIFGDVTAEEAHIERDGKNSETHGVVFTKENKPITLDISRKPDNPGRRMGFSYTYEDGTVVNNENVKELKLDAPPAKAGLFLQDLMLFVENVRGSTPEARVEHQRWLAVRGIELSNELYELAKASPQSANL